MGLVRLNLLRAHGTRWMYTKGCRCGSCRAANATDQRLRRQKNPEAVREYARSHYARNIDAIRERNEKYRAEHRDIYRESAKRHYRAHRDQILVRDSEYARRRYRDDEAVRAAVRVRVRKRRALSVGAVGVHSKDDETAQLARQARQHGKCFWCHGEMRGTPEVDHVIPLALGGSNGPENLVISCRFCNRSKGHQHPMDWAGRLL